MKYYSLLRPIGPGTIPNKGIKEVVNFDEKKFVSKIGREAWGYVVFDNPLPNPENYDLIDEDCMKRHVKVTRIDRETFSLDTPLLKKGACVMNKKDALNFIKSHGCTYEFV